MKTVLLRIRAYLVHSKGQLSEVDVADTLQIGNLAKPPVLIILFGQDADVHQHIYRRGIASLSTLLVYGGVYLANQLLSFTLDDVRHPQMQNMARKCEKYKLYTLSSRKQKAF